MFQGPQSYHSILHVPVESREEILFECVQLFFANPLPANTNLPVYHTIKLSEVKLMEAYVDHFAEWIDIPFPFLFFKEVLPIASLSDKTGIIISAINSCGAAYLHKSDPSQYSHNLALTLLNDTIKMLTDEIGRPDKSLHRCLIVSVLLNLSENILDPDPTIKHTVHLCGSKDILNEIKKTPSLYTYASPTGAAYPFDSQITRYCFWSLVFSDLFSSLKSSSIMWWNPKKWGPESGIDTITPVRDTAWFYCRIFYLLSLVNNLVNHQDVPTLENHRQKIDDVTHNQLIDEIQEWVDTLPEELRPTMLLRTTEYEGFPIISCHGKQQYIMWIAFHAAHILLTNRMLGLTDSNPICQMYTCSYAAKLNHARKIMGIWRSSQDPVVWSCTLWAYDIAAPCLRSQKEKSEASSIFETMNERISIGIRPGQKIYKFINKTPVDI